MRICFVGDAFSALSGTTGPAFALAQELSRQGAEVTILTSSPHANHESVHSHFMTKWGYDKIKMLIVPDLIRTLLLSRSKNRSLIREVVEQNEIIHGFDFLSLYAIHNRIVRDLNARIPLVYTSAGCYKLSIRDYKESGLPSLLNFAKPAFAFKLLCPRSMMRVIFSSFDKILVTSDFIMSNLSADMVPRERIARVMVGIDVVQIERSVQNDNRVNRNLDFAYFGWGSSIRGVPDVLDAFSTVLHEHPDARLGLFFLGSHGIEERYYSSLIKKRADYGTSVFLEVGANKNMLRTIQSSGAIVLPFRSPFAIAQPPLTVLESMLLGKTVISTRTGSIPEVIKDGENGLLVEPNDVDSLAKKMALTFDDSLTHTLGARAKEYVAANHDVRQTAQLIMKFYQEILGSAQAN